MDPPFVREPPIFTAYSSFTIIFAVLFFGQLVLALLLTSIKMTRKPPGGAFGTVTEQEVVLRLHRARFALLMTLMLMLLIIAYSSQAVYLFYSSSVVYTNLTIYKLLDIILTHDNSLEIRNTFLFAVLVAVLDSGIKVSQLRRSNSTVKGMQGGRNMNIIVMSCLVGFLAILAIANIVLLSEAFTGLEHPGFGSSATFVAEDWAQFGLGQARVFIDLVLTIYYTVVAILMWRKNRMVAHESKEAEHNYNFRALERIVKYICPLLILSMIHQIISDVLDNTIINGMIGNQVLMSYNFAYDFVFGVIAFLLNLALISVGYVL